MESGNLSIHSENIFPIIKKWLYSDKDIFYRELISNACDAITKRKKLDIANIDSLPDDYTPQIKVVVNTKEKTIKISDNGIGMTKEEVKEYITQIAFSGAVKFLEKYKDKTTKDQIIGHFGLGFYSVFMVADNVYIDTLSFKKNAKSVHWECDGDKTYNIGEGQRKEVGTTITVFLNEESLEFANEYKAKEVIEKYCSFLPVKIYFEREDAEKKDKKEDKKEEVLPLNDPYPLWLKNPKDCKKEEYISFYRKVFNDYKEPLFWIHLNIDYPFNLKGILYFPKINTEFEAAEGRIKLYNNQIFVADNIKEVIPDYLLLLKGVIDCPDFPLNVSRSALQNDGFIKKICEYISKKVADKLNSMYKTDRENYEKYFEDIGAFVKYGILRDEKFAKKVLPIVVIKQIDDKYKSVGELLEEIKKDDKDKKEDKKEKSVIYYISDEQEQSQYINMFKKESKNAVYLTQAIDPSFITYLEQKNDFLKFNRIDSFLDNDFKEKISEKEEKESEKLISIVKKFLNSNLTIKVEKLKDKDIPSIIVLSEEAQRMKQMMKNYGMEENLLNNYEKDITFILNIKNEIVKYILESKEQDKIELICKHIYDLALLKHRSLTSEEMTNFIKRNNDIIISLYKK